MKFVIIFITLAIYAITMVQSQATDDCEFSCNLEEIQQICGTDDGGERRTFNNFCIMKSENCRRKTTFQKTADGECP